MEVIRSSEPRSEACRALVELLSKNASKSILLMLSGGSAFSLLKSFPEEIFSPKITLSVLDERFSTDSKVNNFAQLQETEFYKQAEKAGVNILPTLVKECDEISGVKNRFETALKNWRNNNPNGVIIATMGVGPDGHTAGIMPGEYGIDFNGSDWVIAYKVPKEVNLFTKRITITNSFLLNEVNEVVVYAVGKEKRQYIEMLKNNLCDTKQFPVCVLKSMSSVKIFTDLS